MRKFDILAASLQQLQEEEQIKEEQVREGQINAAQPQGEKDMEEQAVIF